MGKRNGFTLVEMMIVIAIMGVLFAIAIPQWNRYEQNADLKTAARNIAADIADMRTRAITERLTYTMTFNTAGNNYQIARLQNPGSSTFNNVGDARNISNSGRGHAINMTGASFSGGPANRLRLDVRGTTNNGSISLENARNSTATITVNITGRTHVTFDLQ